jgi:hypothetical protein
MMNLPWWVIVIAIIVIFLIYRIVKGMWFAYSCRKDFKERNGKVIKPKFDEDSEAGDSDNH